MHSEHTNQPQRSTNDDLVEAPVNVASDDHLKMKHQTRRRLLKAAAAAPTIYTLPAGAKVASSSTCIDKPDNFEKLTSDEKKQIKEQGLEIGDNFGDNYVIYSNTQKVKESCWSSLNPGA